MQLQLIGNDIRVNSCISHRLPLATRVMIRYNPTHTHRETERDRQREREGLDSVNVSPIEKREKATSNQHKAKERKKERMKDTQYKKGVVPKKQ